MAEPPEKLTLLSPKSAVHAAAPDPRDVLRWHAGWAGGIILAVLALSFGARLNHSNVVPALATGLIPPLGALILHQRDGVWRRDLLLGIWALCGARACALAGGVAGPLAIWCLTPLVAAVVLGGARRLPLAAALSLLAVAITGLAQMDGLIGPAPAGAAGFGLGLIGVASIAVGLAAAMLAAQRRTARAAEAQLILDVGLRDILDQQPHRIITLNNDGRIDGVFGDALRFLLPTERLLADGLLPIAEPSQQAALDAALGTALVGGQATATFRGAGPRPVWFAIELRRLSPTRLIAILRDATAEHDREAALEQARADAEALNIGKSRFLANMSHELRTPLNAIMGFSDIMRHRMFGVLPSRYGEYADLIHDAGAHLLDLINDVLDMSKIEAARYELSLERLDAREPVQAALRLMRLQADDVGVQLRGVLPSHALVVDADRRALKQITLNLVSNALKFTPKGGLVTVSLHSLAGAMELSVTDTGLGIAAEDLERLGQPFVQAGDAVQQGRGTGLGLSLVRAFAELHGGEMVLESRLGEGTAVTVRVPLPGPEAESPTSENAVDDRGESVGGDKVSALSS